MGLTALPTIVDASLGRTKQDLFAVPDLDHHVPAVEYNRVRVALVDTADEVGIHAGAAGSLNTRVSLLEQPTANAQGGAYALDATDVGKVVFATGAGAQAFSLPTLAAALTAGRVLRLEIQCEGAATDVTITPGAASQINGAGVGVAYAAGAGRKRILLTSRDGLAWFAVAIAP